MPPVLPIWRRVTNLRDLVEIFDPAVRVCTWRREIDPAVAADLKEPGQAGILQALETPSAAGAGLRTPVTLGPPWRA